MTELNIFKFVTENDIEYHYVGDGLFVFIDYELIPAFAVIIKDYLDYNEDDENCKLKNGYIGMNIKPVFDFYGLDIESVFPKK